MFSRLMDYNLDICTEFLCESVLLSIIELLHIQVISGDFLSSPDVLEGKVVLAIIRNPEPLVSDVFCAFFSNSGIPLLFFHTIAFALLTLTSVSAANYIRPCYIHHPLRSSYSGTVNTLSRSPTCGWSRSAFSPQFRRRHPAGLTDS